MPNLVFAPISVGELIDKISILQIKLEKFIDENSLRHIEFERDSLIKEFNKIEDNDIENLHEYQELYKVNSMLWDICEERREMEANNDFSIAYVELSRAEYKTNDQRAILKKKINQNYNSQVFEVKSYRWFNEN